MNNKHIYRVIASFLLLLVLAAPVEAKDKDWRNQVKALVGKGALLVTDADGKELVSIRPDQSYMPASIMKIVTSAAAIEFLGQNYRFVTEFRLSNEGDLYMVGRGDPYLISEELDYIARMLKSKGLKKVRNLLLDNRFFQPGLVLDGTERTLNPYDAYNGALCVNFNTIFVNIAKNGQVTSAEPQTPLTDMARNLALQTKARGKVRFNLADNPETCLQYAGELTKAFLTIHGINVTGNVTRATQDPAKIPMFYKHENRTPLHENIQALLKYSNNFMANQVFLTAGAERYGPPASPEKAKLVIDLYMARIGVPRFHVEEGSGLSRKNSLTARQLNGVLNHFRPYRELLVPQERSLVKTGTLSDVKTLAGYLLPEKKEPLTFVLLMNGTGIRHKTRERILSLLEDNLL